MRNEVYILAKSCRSGAARVSIPARQACVRCVDIIGTEPQMAQVDLAVVRRAQFQLEVRPGSTTTAKCSERN
jgi:hypothetical protein